MRSPKIAFIGAGSTVFAKNLIGDILSYPELAGARVTLLRHRRERLRNSEKVANRSRPRSVPGHDRRHDRRTGARRRRLCHHHDPGRRLQALHRHGFRYSAEVRAAPDHRRHARHRRHHARRAHDAGAARHARDMERLCPDVVHLQYANPMAMNCMGAQPRHEDQDGRPLPHVRHRQVIAADIGVPIERDQLPLRRHQPHGLLFEFRAERREPLSADPPRWSRRAGFPTANRVRYEMFLRLGYFVTESTEHFAEYVPWYIKRRLRATSHGTTFRSTNISRRCVSADRRVGACRSSSTSPKRRSR